MEHPVSSEWLEEDDAGDASDGEKNGGLRETGVDRQIEAVGVEKVKKVNLGEPGEPFSDVDGVDGVDVGHGDGHNHEWCEEESPHDVDCQPY